MKYSFVIKGFIDPRRPDTVTFNFECETPSMEHMLHDVFDKKYPWVAKKFSGRESWFTEGNFNTKLARFRGNGPYPEYEAPTGDRVDVIFNLKEFVCKQV